MEKKAPCSTINLKDPAMLGENIKKMLAIEASGQFSPKLLTAEVLCKNLFFNHSLQSLETIYNKKTVALFSLISQRSAAREQFFTMNENQDKSHLLEEMILRNPYMLNAYGVQKKNLLHETVLLENKQCIKKLLKLNANPNCRDGDNCTPLHIGVESDVSISIIEDLLAAGANPALLDNTFRTPFDIACSKKNSPTTQAFEPYGYLFFSSLWPYQNPYELLKNDGQYLKELANGPLGSHEWGLAEAALTKVFDHIDKNKSVSSPQGNAFINDYGCCILRHASQEDCENLFGKEVFDYARNIIQEVDTTITYVFSLIEENNDTHLENFLQKNTLSSLLEYEMLISCIENNAMACLNVCLNNKFNPNRYHRETSLLHYAVDTDNPKAIKILAKYNADLLIPNENKQTPLEYAIKLERHECRKALTDAIKERCMTLTNTTNPSYVCLEYMEALIVQLEYESSK